MPWALILFAAGTALFALSGPASLRIVALNLIFLRVSLVATSILMGRERKRMAERTHRRSVLTVFLVTNVILFFNGLTFPFYRPTSRFKKIHLL